MKAHPTFFALPGLVLLTMGLRSFYFRRICRTWMICKGVITNSELQTKMGSDGPDYLALIEYTFELNGQAVTGTRVRHGIATNSKEYASKIVTRYPLEQEVSVYYDPKSGRMTLEKGATEGTYFMMFIGAVLAVVVLI